MRVLAARISKTAIPWRTRGPDARRGQLRLRLVWPAIVNAVRQRGALMVLQSGCTVSTVGLAGDSESSPAGMIGVVGTVGQTAGHDRR
jgi:hypothetical protein